jgi:DNA-binding beta-propeller fold protein YncE
MNKKFVALTVAIVATIVVSISAQAGAVAFDAAGNLFLSGRHSIFKYAPDGTKSTYAAGLTPLGLSFDGKGNLFVVDDAGSSLLKFTPDGKRSTFAKGISSDGIAAFDRSGNLFVFQGDSIFFKFTPK